jgi:threonine/homoserine/homoserine lactone efflux protein
MAAKVSTMVLPDPTLYKLFVVAAVVILLIPGPAVVYILTRSVVQGRTAGLVSALGVGLGNMSHVVAATLGLSALLASSALAFSVVKCVGAAYLIVLGVRRLMNGDEDEHEDRTSRSLRRIFAQGVIVNVLNPKIALFFLAFLPQFVDPARGGVAWQIFFLGVTLVLIGICTDSLYALVGGSAGRFLRHNRRWKRSERYVSGGIYITLGVGAALTSSSNK